MNRQEFYKDLGNCAEKLGIEWKLSGDTIRGHGGNYFNEHGFEEYLCPLTAVAEPNMLRNDCNSSRYKFYVYY